MTHGCLKIVAFDDKREMLLHTYHTGMDIPKWVEKAIEERADYFFGILVDTRTFRKGRGEEEPLDE